MPKSAELFEMLTGVSHGLGWAMLAGFTKFGVRVRAYADGRPWSACMLVDGFEIEVTGRADDKGALGWTAETWISVDDAEDTIRAAAVVTAEDLEVQSEQVWSGMAA